LLPASSGADLATTPSQSSAHLHSGLVFCYYPCDETLLSSPCRHKERLLNYLNRSESKSIAHFPWFTWKGRCCVVQGQPEHFAKGLHIARRLGLLKYTRGILP
jgi:hypothetical protein